MIRFNPLPMLSLFAILALALTLTAGRWQWEKFERKSAAAEEPLAEMTLADYQPIPNGLQLVYGVRPDSREQGWRIFAPVHYGDTIVFIDADFFPGVRAPAPGEVRLPPALRSGAPISGGAVRPERPGALAAAPRLLERRWYAIDLERMGRNAGLENVADFYVALAYVGQDGRAVANPFARPPGADELPPARHLGYALTWYGLAVVLVVIYFAYHGSVGRLAFRRPRAPER